MHEVITMVTQHTRTIRDTYEHLVRGNTHTQMFFAPLWILRNILHRLTATQPAAQSSKTICRVIESFFKAFAIKAGI